MLYTVLLVLIPYLGFLAFAKKINPWSKPDEYTAVPRWRRGRRFGFLLFTASAVYLVLTSGIHQSYLEAAIAVSAVVTLALILALIIALIEMGVNALRS